MKIFMLIKRLRYSGAYKMFMWVAKALADKGHYHTAEEAVSKWKRRAARVNYDNLLFIGSEQNGCTEEDVKAFDSIPYPRKLYFCSKPYPYKSVVYIEEFAALGHAGDPYKQGHIYYKYLAKWLKDNEAV